MNCHYQVADTDFSWVLSLRAQQQAAPHATPLSGAVRIGAVRGMDRFPRPADPAQDKARYLREAIAKLRSAQAKIKTR
jgi:hypothetical protein